jgi:hypothetical protein
MVSETWQVVDDEGTAHEVAVDEGRGSARSWWAATPDVARRSHASARDAVVLVAQACEWAVVEVLAPGVETRASEVAHLEARRGALLAEIDRLTARDRVTWGAMPTADEVEAHRARAEQYAHGGAPWVRRYVAFDGVPATGIEVLYLGAIDGRAFFRTPSGGVWYLMRGEHEASQWRPVDADGCAMPRGAQ